MKERCPICEKGFLEKRKIPFHMYGKLIGKFEGEGCNVCNEEYFTEEQHLKIEKKVREMGLWGLESRTKARESGSNLSITVPKRIQEFLGMKKGTELTIIPENEHTLRVSLE